jgi:chemotaxis protein methyltransferase CheR
MLIVLYQVFGDAFGGVPVHVLGTDISTKIRAEAEQVKFRPHALAQTAPQRVSRYFEEDAEKDDYTFDRDLRGHVRFEQHHLLDRLRQLRPFDAIFIRNVMIYIDQESRERVLEHACSTLRPGGLLIAGASTAAFS